MIYFWVLWPLSIAVLIWWIFRIACKMRDKALDELCEMYRHAPDAAYDKLIEAKNARKNS